MFIDLPWNAEGTVARTSVDGHARATELAVAAMNTAADTDNGGMTDYQRARASYEARARQIREENMVKHVSANNKRAQDAAEKRAQRQAEHEARNKQAAEAARQRRLAKAA